MSSGILGISQWMNGAILGSGSPRRSWKSYLVGVCVFFFQDARPTLTAASHFYLLWTRSSEVTESRRGHKTRGFEPHFAFASFLSDFSLSDFFPLLLFSLVLPCLFSAPPPPSSPLYLLLSLSPFLPPSFSVLVPVATTPPPHPRPAATHTLSFTPLLSFFRSCSKEIILSGFSTKIALGLFHDIFPISLFLITLNRYTQLAPFLFE